MCWRDGLSNEEHMASFRALQERFKLRPADAKTGNGAHIDVDHEKGRKYYRRDTFHFAFSGPADTVELILKPGACVRFDEIPESARTALRIGRRRKIAQVVVKGKQVGFDFGKGEKYFPLETEDRIRFTVLRARGTTQAA